LRNRWPRVEHVENVAVHLGRFADHREAHPLAERTRQVAHDARIHVRRVAERAHPALQRLVVQLLRKVGAAPVEAIQLVDLRIQLMLQLAERAAHAVERFGGARVERFGEGFVQRVECACGIALRAFDAQHRRGERFQPARFDQRFAGQAQQTVEIVGAHAQDAVGAARAFVVARRGLLLRCGAGSTGCGRERCFAGRGSGVRLRRRGGEREPGEPRGRRGGRLDRGRWLRCRWTMRGPCPWCQRRGWRGWRG
jgi:hypothetical protein